MRHLAIGFSLLSLLSLPSLSACDLDGLLSGDECQEDADCDDVCDDGKCVECDSDSDCDDDEECDDGDCDQVNPGEGEGGEGEGEEGEGEAGEGEGIGEGEGEEGEGEEGEGEGIGEGEGEGEGLGACEDDGDLGGALRLVDGAGANDGRLEIQINGVFGTICDDGFDAEEAIVACRQLGFTTGIGVQGGGFPPGSEALTIFLDDVVCIGDELQLIDCANIGICSHNCTHGEDVGVTCE